MANGGALNMSAGNAARPVGLNNPNTLTNGGSFGAPAVMPHQQMGPPNFTGAPGPNFIPFNPNLSTQMPGSGIGGNMGATAEQPRGGRSNASNPATFVGDNGQKYVQSKDPYGMPTIGLAPENPTQSPAQEIIGENGEKYVQTKDPLGRPVFSLVPENPTQSPAQEAARGILDQAVGNAPVDLANDFNGDGRVTSADALAKLKADTAAAAAPSGGESTLPIPYLGSEELANRFNEKNPNTADRRPSMPTKFTMPAQPPSGSPLQFAAEYAAQNFTQAPSTQTGQSPSATVSTPVPTQPPPTQIGDPPQQPVQTTPASESDASARAPNINQTAATGINNAIAGATKEMGYRPMGIDPSGYNARNAFGQGYSAAGTSGEGYRAAGATGRGYQAAGSEGQGYNAAQAGSQGFNAAGVDSQGYNSTNAASQGYNSQDTGSVNYNAAQAGSQGYGAQNTNSTGYGAERLGGSPTVAAQNVQAGQIANKDLAAYMNPYEDQVVQSSLSDLNRARQMQQAQAGAQAGAAGAFGGSRQALLEAENNRNYLEQASRTASGLRQAGFQNAQNLGLSDIQTMMQANAANQGANLQADTLTANLAQQAGLANQSAANSAGQFGAQAANQAAMANQAARNQASQFGAASANQASLSNQNALNQAGQFGASAQNSALMANQAAANRASEFGASAANQVGLVNAAASNRASEFGASAANQAAQQAAQQQQQAAMFQAQASNQANLANQNALNQAAQFGAQAQNTSGLANQSALNQAGQFGAQALNTADLANQNALNQAGQFGASARNTAGLANQAALNQAGQFGAQARNTANLSNQNATNNARQFNANQMMNAQMANQNAALQASQQRLSAGNQLGNLSNLGFGMGQTVNQNLAQDGAMKQGINQLLIDAIKQQYAGYTGSPQQSLGLLSQALGVAPVPTSETTSKTPGLFDYLTLGSSMIP